MPNIDVLSMCQLPAQLGGGYGPVIKCKAEEPLPALSGETVTFAGSDHKVLRVQRLFKDAKSKRPSNRVILIVKEQAELDKALADRRKSEPKAAKR